MFNSGLGLGLLGGQGLGSEMASGWEGGLEGGQFSGSGREESHGFALG